VPGERLLVFARAPVAGEAKTRLIPALGAEGAAALHARLTERTVALATSVMPAAVDLWCARGCGHPYFEDLRRRYAVTLWDQDGASLGERMGAALRHALARSRRVVLIGTDCADCLADDVREAFAALRDGRDGVIGPAADGGYWLLGLARWSSSLFEGIDWGSARVLEQTRAALHALGWSWSELELRHDVDRPEDLARLGAGDG
jgi:hypothetical protein